MEKDLDGTIRRADFNKFMEDKFPYIEESVESPVKQFGAEEEASQKEETVEKSESVDIAGTESDEYLSDVQSTDMQSELTFSANTPVIYSMAELQAALLRKSDMDDD